MTLTFKLVGARDQARLPREFGANRFSGSRDISYANKKVSETAPKTEPYAVHCVRAVTIATAATTLNGFAFTTRRKREHTQSAQHATAQSSIETVELITEQSRLNIVAYGRYFSNTIQIFMK